MSYGSQTPAPRKADGAGERQNTDHHRLPLTGVWLPPDHREALYAKLGWRLPDNIWNQSITGHRVLIAPEPVSERTEGDILWKPAQALEREQLDMGAGWIIAAGPLAGEENGQQFPVGLVCNGAAQALGLHVLFKQYSGINLKTTQEDTEFGGRFSLIVLTDRDILSWSAE